MVAAWPAGIVGLKHVIERFGLSEAEIGSLTQAWISPISSVPPTVGAMRQMPPMAKTAKPTLHGRFWPVCSDHP